MLAVIALTSNAGAVPRRHFVVEALRSTAPHVARFAHVVLQVLIRWSHVTHVSAAADDGRNGLRRIDNHILGHRCCGLVDGGKRSECGSLLMYKDIVGGRSAQRDGPHAASSAVLIMTESRTLCLGH